MNKIPDGFRCLQNLTVLILDGNSISSRGQFPSTLLAMVNLERLSILNTGIEELPIDIGNYLKQLKKLNIACNDMQTLPKNIVWPSSLETLIASRNCFKTVPGSLFDLSYFKIIYLLDNKELTAAGMPKNTDWTKVCIEDEKKPLFI